MVEVARLKDCAAIVVSTATHVDFALDQVGDQLWYPVDIAVSGSPLNHHVAPLGVARVP